MNILLKTALCLGAGMLMTFGQSDLVVEQAAAAPQTNQCDSHQNGGIQGQFAQGQLAGCDGNCGQGGCGCGSGGSGGRTFQGQCGCGSGGCNGGCGLRGRLGGRLGGRKINCPGCSEAHLPQEYCELEVSEGVTVKTCYEVDFKTICIPKITPPWKKDCCTPECAEARSVKVLKKKKYKCPSCKYSWKVVKPQLPSVPEMQPTPVNDYYVPAPVQAPPTHGGVPVHGASQITPGQPQPPAVGQYFGKTNQLWQQPQRGMPVPIKRPAELANQHQRMLLQQRMTHQQMLKQQQSVQQTPTARQAKAKSNKGSVGDYYR